MKLTGDFHTHTTYSHGSGSIEDNVKQAIAVGLKQIAITDHGLGHIAFGLTQKKIRKMREEIEQLKQKYKEIEILLGVEANIVGNAGWVDMTEKDFELFDVFLCGYHKFIWPKTVFDTMNFIMYNGLYNVFKFEPSAKTVKLNTTAYVRAIQRYPIDVITHVNLGLKVNCKEVAKAAYDYGTLIEISGKRTSYSDAEFYEMYDTGVSFIINSDAHSPDRVAEVARAVELVERLNIDQKRIVNLEDSYPFKRRFEYYKETICRK